MLVALGQSLSNMLLLNFMYKTMTVVYHTKEMRKVFRQLKNLLSFWKLPKVLVVVVSCLKVTAEKIFLKKAFDDNLLKS